MANDFNDVPGSRTQRGDDRGSRGIVTRGVSYPFMSLTEAVEAARKIYSAERKTPAPVAAAITHLGYAESSSGGRQTISALLQFGLLEDEGRKEDRHVKLTGYALDVLLAEEGSDIRKAALVACVKSPKIYKDIFAKWPDELPSDSTIAYYLQRDKNFNPKAIQSFIKDLRSSLAFVGVVHPRDLDASSSENEPAAVQSIANPAGGAPARAIVPAHVTPSAADLMEHFRSKVATNEKEWMKGSLSKTTEFRLLIAGEIDAKQITRLIKLLEAQRMVLEDDEEI
jgi:hypothetical protein